MNKMLPILYSILTYEGEVVYDPQEYADRSYDLQLHQRLTRRHEDY